MPVTADKVNSANVESPPGVVERDELDIGPVSPELVLVDPVLAERAKRLLVEQTADESPTAGPRSWSPYDPDQPPLAAALPQWAAGRRRGRSGTLLLAVLTFALGAVVSSRRRTCSRSRRR